MDAVKWYPKWIKCRFCGKKCRFVRLYNGSIPEYECKNHGVIRWINGAKLYRVPLPVKVRAKGYYAVFDKQPVPVFWLNTFGIFQDDELNLWYQKEWKVTFHPKTRLFRLYIDGKPIFVKEGIKE